MGKKGLYAHQLPIYDSQDITKGYQKIIPHSTVGRVNAVNKKKEEEIPVHEENHSGTWLQNLSPVPPGETVDQTPKVKLTFQKKNKFFD